MARPEINYSPLATVAVTFVGNPSHPFSSLAVTCCGNGRQGRYHRVEGGRERHLGWDRVWWKKGTVSSASFPIELAISLSLQWSNASVWRSDTLWHSLFYIAMIRTPLAFGNQVLNSREDEVRSNSDNFVFHSNCLFFSCWTIQRNTL